MIITTGTVTTDLEKLKRYYRLEIFKCTIIDISLVVILNLYLFFYFKSCYKSENK